MTVENMVSTVVYTQRFIFTPYTVHNETVLNSIN